LLGVVVGVAVVVALTTFLKNLKKSTTDRTLGLETASLGLARSLLLALDFEVGRDILITILVPSIPAMLAVIVTINSFELVTFKRVG
jgi:uncharacterized membrane protein